MDFACTRCHLHTNPQCVGIPIALRAIYGKRFKRGPFHLGPFSYPVAVISCLWIVFISIAFILPQANPVDSQTLNYAIVAVGIVITYALGFWLISARKWFTGPIKQIAGACSCTLSCGDILIPLDLTAEDMGVDTMDPANSEEGETVQVNVDQKS